MGVTLSREQVGSVGLLISSYIGIASNTYSFGFCRAFDPWYRTQGTKHNDAGSRSAQTTMDDSSTVHGITRQTRYSIQQSKADQEPQASWTLTLSPRESV
ncbi:hypothetical protein CGLO_13734 [Colletotrichum gloeosporioides Cg-14]|uniref:Uncharacterized protein n=1 Tax=Colletotrichum gloeosporioides (strain Cg-14) TaxID=1237896 RepID=T0L6H0_COLGC|nr:hypothetical protein CGLO_13734 [Colletotrichum gloeosporioides Cg-14]